MFKQACENNPIRVYDQLDSRIPMHIGAANKVMLAFMPGHQSESIIHALLPEKDQKVFLQELKK